MTSDRKTGVLRRNGDFRNLWLGQSASMLGSNMTAVAVPLIASVTLSASISELGVLSAASYLPYLLVSLFVGVWVDRKPKRPIIIGADLLRGATMMLVPCAWWLDALTVPLLVGVVLLVGLCSVVADIGNASLLPALVERDDLIEGNSKLELSSSVSNIGGHSLGGVIVQALTGPVAMALNAATFVVSALFTSRVRRREPAPESTGEPGSVWKDAAEGTRFVLGNPLLRVLVLATLVANFFALACEPLFLAFVTRSLDLAPTFVGVILASSGAGALIGAVLAGPMSRRMPLGRLLVFTSTAIGLASLLTPLATVVPEAAAIVLLLVMHVVNSAMVIVCNINLRAYRTSITPDELQGRMTAVVRMVVMGGAPLGAVFGGFLGDRIGVSPALVFASVGLLVAAGIIALSPVRRVTEIPGAAAAPEPTADRGSAQADPVEGVPVD
ncbi:MFS transporter [Kitasatospora sp. NPDC059648]|uniref:MFS transporter n=1 Tax=Kitasatospora sp. NPDC059648 TaxID=3346894 RepID=UPI003693D3AD